MASELEIKPLSTVKELLSFQGLSKEIAEIMSEIIPMKLRFNSLDKSKRARTLVCHDMKGGYLNDR